MAAPCLPLLAAELSCRLPAHPPAAGPSCQPRRLKQQAAGFVRPAPLFGAVRLPSMRYFERAGARPLDGFWAFSPRGVMGVSLSRLDGANAPGTRREPLHATAARPGVLHRLEGRKGVGVPLQSFVSGTTVVHFVGFVLNERRQRWHHSQPM